MIHSFSSIIALTTPLIHYTALTLEIAALAYLCLAILHTMRFRVIPRMSGKQTLAPVTIMVPVKGSPPRLYECLRSICAQDYPHFQVVFGLHEADDPGREVIERVMTEFPHVDTRLIIDAHRIGSNPKICNLSNMYHAVKHDIIVMLDSDVYVDPHFLEVMVAPFADPNVGGVTCLYQGAPEFGLASKLGALYINDWLMPSMLVDLSMREMDLTYGAAVAVTRNSLKNIGGFAAVADSVAEDDDFGELLHQRGYRVVLAPRIVATVVAEDNFSVLWHHELRWMRSVRACRARDHFLSVVMHALLPASLLTALAPFTPGISLLMLMIILRIVLHYLVQARLPVPVRISPLWVPVRECLNFVQWLASFVSNDMYWGEYSLRSIGDRRMSVNS